MVVKTAKLKNTSKYRVVLIRPRNPLNIGAVARVMANFGLIDLVIVNPYKPILRDAKTAVDAHDILKKARVVENVSAAIRDCDAVVGTSCAKARQTNSQWIGPADMKTVATQKSRTAILFGSEKNGLSNDDVNHCQHVLQIPTHHQQPSINLAQSVAIVSFVLSNIKSKKIKEKNLTMSERERLVQNAHDACEKANLFPTWNSKRKKTEIRQMFYRLNLQPKDAAMFHGIFRWMGRR